MSDTVRAFKARRRRRSWPTSTPHYRRDFRRSRLARYGLCRGWNNRKENA